MRSVLVVQLLAVLAACSSALPATESVEPPAPSVDTMADPDLAAVFPDTVGGEPLPVETYRDENALRAMGITDEFLDKMDVELADVSVALAHRPMTTDNDTHLSAYAYRVAGASEDELVEHFTPLMERATEDAEFVPGIVGTRDVWKPVGPSTVVAGNLLYVDGDTAYLLYGNEPAVVALLLEALP